MRFSQDFIDKVRQANNIVEIIGQHTELKGSGHRLMGRCPFPDHSDKSPSFSVTEDNQLYFCYGCKKGGNVFTFLETFNGMSFPEAVEFLARRASVPLPEKDERGRSTSNGVSHDQKDLLLKVNKAAGVYYHQQLKAQPADSPVRKYLEKRGLSEEIVEKFRLGVALDEWQGLVHHFQARKVPLNAAETLGLVKPKKGGRPGDSHFDLFRDRLMFPIFSPQNDVVGFGGRTLGDALPKYVNSSDSPVFSKSRILYGLHETGKFIRAQDEAIVVEGYMDAISLYSAGIKNVVAILGTAFTPEHAKLLKRYTLNVKMLLDGDDAGIGGADRSLPILLDAGLMPKGFVLPDKMDPDDFVKQRGAEALRSEIDRAAELFTLLLTKLWMKDYHGTPSDKVRVLEEAGNSLRVTKNRQLLDLYVLEIARQLDVDIFWVRRALAQMAQKQNNGTQAGSHPSQQHQQQQQQMKFGGPNPRPGGSAPVPNSESASPFTSGSVSTSTDSGEPPDLNLPSDYEIEEPLERITVKSAPKDEAFVLSLLLYNENLMRELLEAGPDEVYTILSHEGVRKVLKLAVETYRLKPDQFSDLAAGLASKVDHPAILACSIPLMPLDTSEGSDRKLMADYLNAIRQRFLKRQAKVLTSQIRDGASPEQLEAFMNLQRDLLNRNKES